MAVVSEWSGTGWSKATVTSNFSLASLKITKNGITQPFLEAEILGNGEIWLLRTLNFVLSGRSTQRLQPLKIFVALHVFLVLIISSHDKLWGLPRRVFTLFARYTCPIWILSGGFWSWHLYTFKGSLGGEVLVWQWYCPPFRCHSPHKTFQNS